MRRLLVLAIFAALAASVATTPAAAKGPSEASLSGPGLDRSLPVRGDSESGPGTPLGSLAEFSGFFPQVFRRFPDPTTRTRPPGDLGPRYTVAYRVPGPSGVSTIVQDVYPYAKPQPVTHMRAGQPFWNGTNLTYGGWLVSSAELKEVLVKAGLPESPPSPGVSFPWAWTGAGAGIAAVFVLLVLALRRSGIARFRAVRSTA